MSLAIPRARTDGRIGLDRSLAVRAAAILGYNLLFLTWLALRPLDGFLATAVGDLAHCIGPFVALALCARWRAPRHARRASLLLSLGTLLFGLGQAVWSYYELVLRRPLPLPSWSDACFLAIYPCLLLGLLRLPGRPLSPARRTRVLLDGLLVMVTAAAVSWYFLLGLTLLATAGTPLRTLVGAAYPLGDLVLLSCLLLLGTHTAGGTGQRLLALGLGIIIVTDSAFLRSTLWAVKTPSGARNRAMPPLDRTRESALCRLPASSAARSAGLAGDSRDYRVGCQYGAGALCRGVVVLAGWLIRGIQLALATRACQRSWPGGSTSQHRPGLPPARARRAG
jgi:hypothetical protein